MGLPDLSNPQVLKNWLKSQMKEGNGKFVHKKDVLIFRMEDGSEFIAPPEILKEIEVVSKETGEKVMETPEEPEIAGTPKKKKKKIEV